MQTFKNLHSTILNSNLSKYQSERIFIASLIVLTSKLTSEDEVVKFEPLVRAITSKIELTDEEYYIITDYFIEVETAKQRIKENEMEMIADQDNWDEWYDHLISDSLIQFEEGNLPQEDELPF